MIGFECFLSFLYPQVIKPQLIYIRNFYPAILVGYAEKAWFLCVVIVLNFVIHGLQGMAFFKTIKQIIILKMTVRLLRLRKRMV